MDEWANEFWDRWMSELLHSGWTVGCRRFLMYLVFLGHNWGSEHDPDTTECSPAANVGGKYIMFTYSVSGIDSNNKVSGKVKLPCQFKVKIQLWGHFQGQTPTVRSKARSNFCMMSVRSCANLEIRGKSNPNCEVRVKVRLLL